MLCPFCGRTIQDDAVFCTMCGKKLSFANEIVEPKLSEAELSHEARGEEELLRELKNLLDKRKAEAENLKDQLMEKEELISQLKAELTEKSRQLAQKEAASEPAPIEAGTGVEPVEEASEPAPIEAGTEDAPTELPTENRLEHVESPTSSQGGQLCPSCGHLMPLDYAFCTNCGTKLKG